ncbi:MAG: 30S ribosomal protein S4 [Thaumarchaeota archaeon]|nr:30S ribosomal protein S4 [Nitrososphaerota archaeon]
MGDPKKSRKKFTPPRNPWRSDQLSQELYLLGTYGLRNKKELWRAQTKLSNYRKQARQLLAASADIRGREEPKLLNHLGHLGLVEGGQSSLDDVLSLTVENVLERRLQTLVWKRGLAKSPYQARQIISHGHVELNRRKVTVPSYLVSPAEEGSLRFSEGSKLAKVSVAAESSTSEPEPQPDKEQDESQ